MIIKRFLVPVLTFAALGLPVRATVVAYCDGGGCGANTNAAFVTFVTANALTYANATDLAFTGTLTSGGTQYNDGLTQVLFADSNMFTITGSNALQAVGSHDTINITVPAAYSVIRLSLDAATQGFFFTCLDAGCNKTVNLTNAAQYVDYVNDAPGSSWNITISANSADMMTVNGFDPAGAGGGSETPEIGTLLLIGAGLISMRWMRRWPRGFVRTLRTV